MTDTALLEVHNLVKSFGGLRAVNGASFSVARGSLTALIGPNGAGKTTLFHILAGFLRADGGRVSYEGRPILGKPAHAIARLGIVRTFQLTRTLGAMTVLENMLLAAPRQPGERLVELALRPRAVRRREREIVRHARELLALLDLETHADAYAGTLSGGQRKLLELGRALMVEPRLVLLDEPMAGINRTLGARLIERIQHLRAAHNMTFLFVEHDMDVVMQQSDQVVVMAEGCVIASGDPAAVRQNPAVVDAYLGARHEAADA